MSRVVDPIHHASKADWVEAAKLSAAMKGMHASQVPALLVAGIMAALCYPHVPRLALGAVLALALGVAVLRFLFGREYRRVAASGQVGEELAYLRRRHWFVVLIALSWGAWPLLFHGRLPPTSEMVCWMLVAGVGGVPVGWVSAHLKTTRMFLLTFVACSMLSVGLRVLLWPDQLTQAVDFWLPVILGVYWLLLWRIAMYLNGFYSSSFELTYNNERLIHSLREQTRLAQEALRFKDRFLAGAAHDLKQPVNALGIYAEWLSNEPELVHELGPKILQSTQAINTLFDSLFDLVKLQAGRFTVDRQPVYVTDMLHELRTQYAPLAMQKGLTLRVRAVRAHVVSDPVMLRRLIANLLANAIRYTPGGGVLLTARLRADAVLVQVWDTGIGIAGHEQAQVFDEFYKVPASGTEEGFGLGLSIVRRLADRLGCEVGMRSMPARGTVFSVRVPLGSQAPVTGSAGRSSGQSAGSASGS
ncbi:MAG: HAMP domain-containing sensor histidine kinase [Pseudomonadota bacterium]|nr:HAMP domain-containing sensor histidine kinase [Pseudomonadota bacterium]